TPSARRTGPCPSRPRPAPPAHRCACAEETPGRPGCQSGPWHHGPDRRWRERPMPNTKLGVLLWNQATSWPDYEAAARRVDELGYDSLWSWDHLYAIFGDPLQPIFEGYT